MAKMDYWVQRCGEIILSVSLKLLQVLLKVFYYDTKTRDNMEERLQKIIQNSQTKFIDEIREIQESLKAIAEMISLKSPVSGLE